jgi:quinol monooxygenase YgiN
MIYGVVSVRVKEGKLQEWLELFKANAAKVREEKGCTQYFSLVDIDANIPIQTFEKNVVTVLEQWESVEALHDHFDAPHMAVYFEKEKEFVEDVTVKMLQDA